jgi:hypothetical protein
LKNLVLIPVTLSSQLDFLWLVRLVDHGVSSSVKN